MDKEIPLNISPALVKMLGTTEEEIIKIIDKIANKLSYKFTFGCYTREDIEQEARIIALEGLDAYNPDMPLENFLWVHVKNRLCNLKRKKYIRLDKPCLNCPLKAYIKPDGCSIFQNKMDCELYSKWTNRNEAKKNIINPVSMSSIVDTDENNMYKEDSPADKLYTKELIELLDQHITPDVRPIWLQLKGGLKIHNEDMERLKERVRDIMEMHNVKESW
jgi:DNA-directed RNA polymerase specialized sigma24 family protein